MIRASSSLLNMDSIDSVQNLPSLASQHTDYMPIRSLPQRRSYSTTEVSSSVYRTAF